MSFHNKPYRVPTPVIQQLTPASQQAAAEKDLGLFGTGDDVFKILTALFAPTSSRVTCPRVVLPHLSVKQAELVKETESTPTPPLGYQGGVDLVEDDGLDYLFDNSMDGHETIAEDDNATADTGTQSRSAAKHTPEPQNEGGGRWKGRSQRRGRGTWTI